MFTSIKLKKKLEMTGLMSASPERDIDELLNIGHFLLRTPAAFISFINEDTQFVKAQHAFGFAELTNPDWFVFEEETINYSIHNSIDTYTHLASFPIKVTDELIGTITFLDKNPIELSEETLHMIRKVRDQLLELVTKRLNYQLAEFHTKQFHILSDVVDASRIGTWTWNVRTGQVSFNNRWFEIVGYTRKELEPIDINTWYLLVHPDDRAMSDEALRLCFKRETEFYEVQLRMKHKDGRDIWINDRGKVVEWSEDGDPLVMTGTHVDISDRVNKEVLYKAITDNVPGIVFRYHLESDGRDWVQVINKGVLDVWGYTAEEVRENLLLVWERIDSRDVERLRNSVLHSKDTLMPWKEEWRYAHPDGSIRWLRGNGNPSIQPNEKVVWDTFIEDVTDRINAETQLRESERLLVEAQRYAKMGNWNFDFRKDKLTWSEALYDVFGVEDQNFIETHGSFLSLIVQEDREYAKRVSEYTQQTGEPFNVKYRIITPKGERRIIEEFGYAEKDANGKVVRLFGTAQDVTEMVEVKKALQENTYQTQVVERKRIAQALHDSLQQTLIATLMNLNALDDTVMGNKNLQTLHNGKSLLQDAIQQARTISHDLIPPEIDAHGLQGALEELVDKYQDTDIEIKFENYLSDFQQLPITLEIGLYRIAQEGLSNVLKHARATASKITLNHIDKVIEMTVSDNGVGIPASLMEKDNCVLTGICNRVQAIGCILEVDSKQGEGTSIKVKAPFSGM